MSMDIRFIAFSEKVADKRWKAANLFDFLAVFDELEKEDSADVASVQDELILIDFEMGGVMIGLDEGKHFNWFIEKLVETFISDETIKKKLIKDIDIEPEMQPKELYIALFDLVSEKEIRKRFPNDSDASPSLLLFYQNFKPILDVLHDPDRTLYIDVNDELMSSVYFINRAKEHRAIVQGLYTKWKEAKSKAVIEDSHDNEATSKKQTPLF